MVWSVLGGGCGPVRLGEPSGPRCLGDQWQRSQAGPVGSRLHEMGCCRWALPLPSGVEHASRQGWRERSRRVDGQEDRTWEQHRRRHLQQPPWQRRQVAVPIEAVPELRRVLRREGAAAPRNRVRPMQIRVRRHAFLMRSTPRHYGFPGLGPRARTRMHFLLDCPLGAETGDRTFLRPAVETLAVRAAWRGGRPDPTGSLVTR